MSDHLRLIEEIERAVSEEDFNLSSWEDEFIQSLKGREVLTDKQDAKCMEIWERARR